MCCVVPHCLLIKKKSPANSTWKRWFPDHGCKIKIKNITHTYDIKEEFMKIYKKIICKANLKMLTFLLYLNATLKNKREN